MHRSLDAVSTVALRLLHFSGRVLSNFLHNRGLLLAGGVAYNMLLSAIPFFAITITALSYVVDEQKLLRTVSTELELLVPNQAQAITSTLEAFLRSRDVVGVLGFAVLIFFSSIAFRMLEEAVGDIFDGDRIDQRRKWWVSVLLPYVLILALSFALLLITALQTGLDALRDHTVHLAGHAVSFRWAARLLLRVSTFASLVMLFTGVYKVMPVTRVSTRRALVGGLVAASLWALLGRALGYYFANVSLVNVIYGSLATVVVILLTMEAASIIVLLGAQVIAELEHSARAGRKWYQGVGDGASNGS